MSRFIPILEAVELPMLGDDDYLQKNKGRLLRFSKMVFEDLNLSVLKMTVRERFAVNKRTNTVQIPSYADEICSVNVMDHNGVQYPIFRNDRFHNDIVDIPSSKDCNCEFNCGFELCNSIKGYEAVISQKSDQKPDGSTVTFTCVDRKAVDENGFFYSQTQYPIRIYNNGVWTDTILKTENQTLCQVEVNANGCVCDTPANINAVCNACGISNVPGPAIGGNAQSFNNMPNVDTWIYYCSRKLDWFGVQCGCFPGGFRHGCNNMYNINELGNQLVFPSHFGWDHVIVRFYKAVNTKDIQIPFRSLHTFVTGLKYFEAMWNDKKEKEAARYSAMYAKQKWADFIEMNKYRIAEAGMILAPPVHIPGPILEPWCGWW